MKRVFLVLLGFLILLVGYSQAPNAFKYQAVVRDNAGILLADQSVNIQVDIIQGSVDGPTVYSEIHAVQTNGYGLVNLEIGSGTTSADFTAIGWHGDSYFIKIWVNGNEMGTSQLLSVPYAIHAQSAEEFTGDEIKNIKDPVEDQDVATKAYVDRQITNPGIRIHAEIDSILCFDDSDGAIDLTVSGGTPPYIFEWDNGSTSEDIDGLNAGKYQVYVEGSKGMTAFRHFSLFAPEEIVISYVSTPGPGTIDLTVSSGTPPYTYLWSNGSTDEDQSGLEMETYSVVVTDALGCSAGESIPMGVESGILAEYLESAAGGNYANTAMAAIKSAADTRTGNIAGTMYLVDIRSAADYAAGHVVNAVNVAAADILSHLDGTDADDGKDVVVICYSGQTAAWATCLLRLSGYDNAYSMLFGMCSWNADFAGSWNGNVSNTWAASFEDDMVAKGPAGDLPVLNTGKTTGEEILKARVSVVLAEGFGAAAIGNAVVFGALDNYYVANYWAEADYTHYGHVPGASQYTPKASIALDVDLLTLPTDKPVVVYCWTGQTSANMAAYLRVIGYDAKSLKFGANGMIYDELEAHKWSESVIMGYDYETE